MKITDDVIVKFFGQGKGFTMTSIKRWGSFIKNEDDLDHAHYHAIRNAVSAKDREIEFDNEVHMVNYLMRLCYWGWCEAIKTRLKVPILLESQLVPAGEDEDTFSTRLEESVEPTELVLKPFRLHEISSAIVKERLGEVAAQIFDLHYVKELEVKIISKKMNLTEQQVRSKIGIITRLLTRRLKTFARTDYQIYRKRF